MHSWVAICCYAVQGLFSGALCHHRIGPFVHCEWLIHRSSCEEAPWYRKNLSRETEILARLGHHGRADWSYRLHDYCSGCSAGGIVLLMGTCHMSLLLTQERFADWKVSSVLHAADAGNCQGYTKISSLIFLSGHHALQLYILEQSHWKPSKLHGGIDRSRTQVFCAAFWHLPPANWYNHRGAQCWGAWGCRVQSVSLTDCSIQSSSQGCHSLSLEHCVVLGIDLAI